MTPLIYADIWPFVVLLLSIILVIGLIAKWHFHPFIALILTAIFVGFLIPELPLVSGQHPLVTAVELPMVEFGSMAGKIGWVIALAAVIGTAMMESGAAERIVNWLLKSLGAGRAAVALIISGCILSIPVFFDTVFFLLIPIGITLALKTGKDFVLYIAAIGGGAVITHSLVPPTPGPLIMAETLAIDLGIVILAGLAAGVIPAVAALKTAQWLNQRMTVPVRIKNWDQNPTKTLPSLTLSLMPVVIPLVLISLASVVEVISGQVFGWIAFLGNKNIAMAAGTLFALVLWKKTQKLDSRMLWEALGKPLEIGGIIILITSAGGAYGAMIAHSGIGDAISGAIDGININYLVLAWVIAAVMKTAQGSGTVAMISSAAIMAALMGPEAQLPYHPVYVLLAMGFGSLFVSWMNDSGFWVVTKLSGLTEKEGLKTWTSLLAIISLVGLFQVLLFSWFFPFI